MEDQKTNKVLVNVVLDRSGSMSTGRDRTISGYNEYLHGLRADKETEYSISLIQFDSPSGGPELTVKYADKPLAEVPDLTPADYEPRGMTPLYDAIGECVRRVETKGRSVLAVIITDGMENASTEFTQAAVKALIAEKEKEGWTFAFLGADIDSYAVGGGMGMSAANVSNYARGMESAVYQNVARATVSRSMTARNVGVKAAGAAPMFTNSMRASMGDRTGPPPTPTKRPTPGGRPAAQPRFRPQPKKDQAVPSGRKRTDWKTT